MLGVQLQTLLCVEQSRSGRAFEKQVKLASDNSQVSNGHGEFDMICRRLQWRSKLPAYLMKCEEIRVGFAAQAMPQTL